MEKSWYSQREWDRVVGWGNVPVEYSKSESEDNEKSENERISDKSSTE
tara:strand:+ start:624 stop:767 length:144 start_codon:yes stop_codon:yes gene_type:complete